MITRRSLIGSMIALVASPAIVRCASLMPVKAMEPRLMLDGVEIHFDDRVADMLAARMADAEIAQAAAMNAMLWDEMVKETRNAFLPRMHVSVLQRWPEI